MHIDKQIEGVIVSIISQDMNYYLVWILSQTDGTDGQTESDAYEPIVQFAQVGKKINGKQYNGFIPWLCHM